MVFDFVFDRIRLIFKMYGSNNLENGIALSEYSTDKIYLSPDGVPKVYILHASPDNRHNSYYEVLSDD